MHSSAVAGHELYVFGSYNCEGKDKIEWLDVNSVNAPWTTIQSDLFTPRYYTCAVALSSRQILIMGGSDYPDWKRDVLMLSTETGVVRKVKDAPFGFCSIRGNNQTYLERPGVVLSLVGRDDGKDVLLRYDAKSFSILAENVRY